jgi:hypothetical protein
MSGKNSLLGKESLVDVMSSVVTQKCSSKNLIALHSYRFDARRRGYGEGVAAVQGSRGRETYVLRRN